MIQTRKNSLLIILCFLFFSIRIKASEFQYGQCLLDKVNSYSAELTEYNTIALAKAEIKSYALKKNPALLKWNFETVNFIYSVSIILPAFILLKEIYSYDNVKSVEMIKTALSGSSGHLILMQMAQGGLTNSTTQSNYYNSFLEFLGSNFETSVEINQKLLKLLHFFENKIFQVALLNVYKQIQELSLDSGLLDPKSLNQWIEMTSFFNPDSENKKMDVSNLISTIKKNQNNHEDYYLTEDTFRNNSKIIKALPPLLKFNYPMLPKASASSDMTDPQKLIYYFYTRSIENYLFGKNDLTLPLLEDWLSQEKKGLAKKLLTQALKKEIKSPEESTSSFILRYLINKQRVLTNAFDQFVWSTQASQITNFTKESKKELSIDAVARTLYSEAESCHDSNVHQFEAIGAIIAQRAIAINQENALFSRYSLELNMDIISNQKVISKTPIAGSYRNAVSDFGRKNEVRQNPIVSQMTSQAQVVSKPGQFAVWKIGNNSDTPVTKWIPQLKELKYPSDMKLTVIGTTGIRLDSAQRKALCPSNNEIFQDALSVAKEVVENSYEFTKRYQFYQRISKKDGRYVKPYFYTHGAGTRLGARAVRLTGTRFYKITDNKDFTELPTNLGSPACKTFAIYGAPADFLWTASAAKKAQRQN